MRFGAKRKDGDLAITARLRAAPPIASARQAPKTALLRAALHLQELLALVAGKRLFRLHEVLHLAQTLSSSSFANVACNSLYSPSITPVESCR